MLQVEDGGIGEMGKKPSFQGRTKKGESAMSTVIGVSSRKEPVQPCHTEGAIYAANSVKKGSGGRSKAGKREVQGLRGQREKVWPCREIFVKHSKPR